MSLSIIIPVYNESSQITKTLKKVLSVKKKIKELEIVVVNDFSTDNTQSIVKKLSNTYKNLKLIQNKKKGLGSAIQTGIVNSKKKFICIFMGDLSDDVNDLYKYYSNINNTQLDAILGTRFSSKSKITDYPIIKLILNRIFNNFVKIIFLSKYNDFTNAFKIYRRKTLLKILPIVSEHFNVFLELPLKIIARKYKYSIIPINWKNRKIGKSNFKIKELSSMYLFTLCYCILEKILINYKNKK